MLEKGKTKTPDLPSALDFLRSIRYNKRKMKVFFCKNKFFADLFWKIVQEIRVFPDIYG